jgi:hypothetical protein
MAILNDITSHERMMKEMTAVANVLGGFLPDSYPQFLVGLKIIFYPYSGAMIIPDRYRHQAWLAISRCALVPLRVVPHLLGIDCILLTGHDPYWKRF